MYYAEGALLDADKFPPFPFLKFNSTKGFYASQIMFAGTFCLPLQDELAKEWPQLQSFADKTKENISVYKNMQQ